MPYNNTLITVAEDCPVKTHQVPVSHRANTPSHITHYHMLIESPYKYCQKDLIYAHFLQKEGLYDLSMENEKMVWDKIFAKGHPCMRASALTKRYGFGAHYNRERKIALLPMESEEYRTILHDDSIKKLSALRSKKKH